MGLIFKIFYHTSVPRNISTEKDKLAWINIQGNEEDSMLNLQALHTTIECDKSSLDAKWILVSVELLAKSYSSRVSSYCQVKIMLVATE